jgi:hypothetical protein
VRLSFLVFFAAFESVSTAEVESGRKDCPSPERFAPQMRQQAKCASQDESNPDEL